jgi:hypothetical protein
LISLLLGKIDKLCGFFAIGLGGNVSSVRGRVAGKKEEGCADGGGLAEEWSAILGSSATPGVIHLKIISRE